MININSVGNPHYSTITDDYIDVTLDTVELGHIPSTLSNTDFTEYNIFDHTSNSYIPITNQQLFLNAEAGMYGNVAPFALDVPNAKQIAYQKIAEACDAISSQVIPNQTKQLAYQNALLLLTVNNGVPPTSGMTATAFNNLAMSWGMTPAVFGNLILSMQQLSINLGTLELTFQSEVSAVQSATQLNTVLQNFETQITNFVNQINTMVPVPIARPNQIKIKGVNI